MYSSNIPDRKTKQSMFVAIMTERLKLNVFFDLQFLGFSFNFNVKTIIVNNSYVVYLLNCYIKQLNERKYSLKEIYSQIDRNFLI